MMTQCPICKGSGEMLYFDEDGDYSETCKACQGAGHIPKAWSDDYLEHNTEAK